MKVLLSGAVASLVAGILLGGAMQPHLDAADDRPVGPQMSAGWGGPRSAGPFDPGATFPSGQATTPDYVLGTDWKKSMAWPVEPPAVSAPREIVRTDPPPQEPAALTHSTYQEPAPLAHVYPSMNGENPSVIQVAPAEPADDAAPQAGG